MMFIAIVADDLTGACDTAIKIKSERADVRVSFRLPDASLISRPPQVLAVPTNSRVLDGQQAYDEVYRVTVCLKELGAERFYKKVDSLLRGNVTREIHAMMDVLGAEVAIVAPAAPLNDRKVIDGVIISESMGKGFPVRERMDGYTAVPLGVVREGATAILRRIEAYRSDGARVLVFDSETPDDLDSIALACGELPCGFLPVGSSGFITSMGKLWGMEAPQEKLSLPRQKPGPLLYVIGTFHPVTRAQTERLMGAPGTATVILDTGACLEGGAEAELARALREAEAALEQGAGVLLLALDSVMNGPVHPERGTRESNGGLSCRPLSDCIARVAQQLLESRYIPAMVLTGGDTAQSVFNALGLAGLLPVGELLPGIPMSNVNLSGGEPLYAVTKSGGFGEENALLTVRDFLFTLMSD